MSKESERRANEQTFHGLFSDGSETPESIMVQVMNGKTHICQKGHKRRITNTMIDAAKCLLPYRLPRLNAIDAVNRNVEMTHEEWVRMMDEGQ